MESASVNVPWLIFRLLNQHFAVSIKYVREMVILPAVVSVPETPPFIRGVMDLRGKVLPVLDLRMRLGMESLLAEVENIIKLLEVREQDHRNWITELEASVRERRAFKLATDPHQCAFGKWYDTFKTENRMLDSCLKKFEAPHNKIHGIAIRVKELVDKEDFDSAYEIIDRTRGGELAEMIGLFSEARMLVGEANREIALCMELNGKAIAAAVDAIEVVEKISETNFEAFPESISSLNNGYIAGIGKRKNGADLVQLLAIEKIICQEEGVINCSYPQ
jgi:purine-binding chemotaxis protein CheW